MDTHGPTENMKINKNHKHKLAMILKIGFGKIVENNTPKEVNMVKTNATKPRTLIY